MRRRPLLQRLSEGNVNNVRFRDFQNLLEGFGFTLERISGSHYIYNHPLVPGVVSLQDVNGQAKPYQVRQFLRTVERYSLRQGNNR